MVNGLGPIAYPVTWICSPTGSTGNPLTEYIWESQIVGKKWSPPCLLVFRWCSNKSLMHLCLIFFATCSKITPAMSGRVFVAHKGEPGSETELPTQQYVDESVNRLDTRHQALSNNHGATRAALQQLISDDRCDWSVDVNWRTCGII